MGDGPPSALGDLSALRQLPRLRRLSLAVRDGSNWLLRPPCTVGGLLQHLDLTDQEKLWDLEPLRLCPELRSLKLAGCTFEGVDVLDLQLLGSCPKLETLDVSLCMFVADLRPLSSCSGLREIRALGCPQLTHLPSLPELQLLDVAHCCALSDLAPLLGHVVGNPGDSGNLAAVVADRVDA